MTLQLMGPQPAIGDMFARTDSACCQIYWLLKVRKEDLSDFLAFVLRNCLHLIHFSYYKDSL